MNPDPNVNVMAPVSVTASFGSYQEVCMVLGWTLALVTELAERVKVLEETLDSRRRRRR